MNFVIISIICTILVSYLIGSISFAAIVAKANGVDILHSGSGNAGATNVRRVVGKFASKLVFFLDVAKGSIATILPFAVYGRASEFSTQLACIALFFAVVGHSFSIFLRLKGGKGVAIAMGGLLVLMPEILFVGSVFWYMTFHATRIVSLASITFAATLPLTTYLLGFPKSELILSFVLAVFIFVMHHSNIVRLINGTESKS